MGEEFLVGGNGSETTEMLDKKASSKEACLGVILEEIEDYKEAWTVEKWQSQVDARDDYAKFSHIYPGFNALVVPSLLNAVFPDATGLADDDHLILKDWGFKVRDVSKPVSIWNGDQDKGVPVGQAHWQHAQINASTIHILEGQNHVTIMVEAMEPIIDSAIAKLNQ
jgi:pimeloyl-ACP methyl ester carboxylesterase